MACPSCSVRAIIWTSEAPDSDSTFAEAQIILIDMPAKSLMCRVG